MIRLENIRIDGDSIVCDAFLEDCKTPIQLSVKKEETNNSSPMLPSGYEWCRSYVKTAERYLKTLFNEKTMPIQKTIYWG